MLKKILSMKFKKKPSGAEKMIMKSKRSKNPYCSSMIITSVLTGKIAKSNFEPSSGGNGIRLKKAKITFQSITIINNEKNIEFKEPDTAAESCAQSLWATDTMMAIFTAEESVKSLPTKAAIKAIAMLEAGPPKATRAGPHFWFLRL